MNHPIFGTVSTVYWWNRQAKNFYVVNQGGTSSSKTYSIMQVICEQLMNTKLRALVTGSHHHTLEQGAKADLQDIISNSPHLANALLNPDAEGSKFMFKNGSRLVFKAYDTPKKAKPGKRDILFINEANNVPYEIAHQLMTRTKVRVFLDYNSDTRFWVHDQILKYERDRTDYIISNFTHNQYCPQETINSLEQILRKSKETQSEYWINQWKVYGLGLTGSVSGTIFGHNYHKIPDFDRVKGLRQLAYFVDFGYSNDPTAVGIGGMKFGNFYGKQLLYETGYYGERLAIKLRDELKLNQDIPMICDNDKASVAALQRYGFNARIAKKPKVIERITMMQEIELYIDEKSYDWHYEQMNYKFKLNPVTAEYTNEPIDKHNHLFDGAGYYLVAVKGIEKERSKRRYKAG